MSAALLPQIRWTRSVVTGSGPVRSEATLIGARLLDATGAYRRV
ncbi:hypothetical protein DFJ65_1233 [Calidifontibacter indicus]|uniref:Uncharacterized protein n=1 Tax=Calidifontibacter indicus TaxID=419650 RepID=A0A3D9UUD0_9MICO|nr:hypothetical protein DFJ65_1233 [Calidifontibacter indicus]